YINPAGQELWDLDQVKESEVVEYIKSMIHMEDTGHVIEKIREFLSGNGSNSLEFRITIKGIVSWICLNLFSVNVGQGENPKLLAFSENITSRKEYELYLYKHNGKKNSILNILSHDLKGPLSNISLISGVLKEEYQKETL